MPAYEAHMERLTLALDHGDLRTAQHAAQSLADALHDEQMKSLLDYFAGELAASKARRAVRVGAAVGDIVGDAA